MAQQTKQQLIDRSEIVRIEAVRKANTAERVGSLMKDMSENLIHIAETVETNITQFGTDGSGDLLFISPYLQTTGSLVSFNLNYTNGSLSVPNTSDNLTFDFTDTVIMNRHIVYSRSGIEPSILSSPDVKLTGDVYQNLSGIVNILEFVYLGTDLNNDHKVLCNVSTISVFEP